MTEMEKDHVRIQHDNWYAKSIGCPCQWRQHRDFNGTTIVNKRCAMTESICRYEHCPFAHWGLV